MRGECRYHMIHALKLLKEPCARKADTALDLQRRSEILQRALRCLAFVHRASSHPRPLAELRGCLGDGCYQDVIHVPVIILIASLLARMGQAIGNNRKLGDGKNTSESRIMLIGFVILLVVTALIMLTGVIFLGGFAFS